MNAVTTIYRTLLFMVVCFSVLLPSCQGVGLDKQINLFVLGLCRYVQSHMIGKRETFYDIFLKLLSKCKDNIEKRKNLSQCQKCCLIRDTSKKSVYHSTRKRTDVKTLKAGWATAYWKDSKRAVGKSQLLLPLRLRKNNICVHCQLPKERVNIL